MEPIRHFAQLTAHLKPLNKRKRLAVVCANDPNTEYAISRDLEEGIAAFLMKMCIRDSFCANGLVAADRTPHPHIYEVKKVLQYRFPQFEFSVSATSRAPRGAERDGIDYFFLSPEAFRQAVREDRFVECVGKKF